MGDDAIRIQGQQHLDRTQGDQATTHNHKIAMEIDGTHVAAEIMGLESRQRMTVYSNHPAVVDHFRRLDEIQRIIHIAEREAVPEPIREPVGRIPEGKTVCPGCGGAGLIEAADEGDALIECRRCHGDGLVMDDDDWDDEAFDEEDD